MHSAMWRDGHLRTTEFITHRVYTALSLVEQGQRFCFEMGRGGTRFSTRLKARSVVLRSAVQAPLSAWCSRHFRCPGCKGGEGGGIETVPRIYVRSVPGAANRLWAVGGLDLREGLASTAQSLKP